jgi:hypothetical protein
MKTCNLPSKDYLDSILRYDTQTGELFWRVSPARNVKAGSKAKSRCGIGYLEVTIDRTRYKQHRIVWRMVTGEDPGELTIDHINRNRSDNRFENLRLATTKQQGYNRGAKGCWFHKRDNCWASAIKTDSGIKHLGSFDCPVMARIAYLDAKKQYHTFQGDQQ